MKKFFASIALLATACLSVFAEEGDGYRRTWDFTKGWSATTIAKLEADAANWQPQSTGFQNNPTAMTANETPWVMVDGVKEPIAELVGMTINSSLAKAKHCQICTTGSGLAGVPCFWLNGKGDAVSVKVPAGENVRFGYTAHGAQDRGFSCNAGFADAAGATKWTNPDNMEIHEVELINSNEGEATLSLKTENGGCHIYYIIIGAGDADSDFDPSNINVGYVYDGVGLDDDVIYQNYVMNYDATPIDITTTEASVDSLASFDVLVYSSVLTADTKGAADLVELDEKVPVLNLSAALYAAWGWGEVGTADVAALTVSEDFLDAALFESTNAADGELTLFEAGQVATFTATPGSFITDDDVYAANESGAAIHTHGAVRNAYILVPCPADNESLATITDDCGQIINNAITILYGTKAALSATPKPTITPAYYDGYTTVSVTCANKAALIYVNGELYTESFNVTESGTTVEAYAVAHGYKPSAVVSAVIDVHTQAKAPSISAESAEGMTTLTLTKGDEADIYYSFVPVSGKEQATLYEEPVVVKEPGTIYAFAASATQLQSEVVSSDFTVGGIPAVKDTLAHYNAGQTDWFDNAILMDADKNVLETPTSNWSTSAAYYFGKSAWNYFGTEIESQETVTGSEGQDSIVYHYKADPAAVKYVASATDTDWIIRTQGQALTGETTIAQLAYVKGEGVTAAGRYHDSAIDLIGGPATKGCLTMGGKVSGDPYSASIESTKPYTAPFDIVVYANQGNGDGASLQVEIQVSADGENWTAIGDVNLAYTMRHIKKTRLHYEEATPVYVRVAHISGGTKAQICDIYVISTEGLTGIESIAEGASQRDAAIFDLQGRQVSTMVPGHIYIQNGKKLIVR